MTQRHPLLHMLVHNIYTSAVYLNAASNAMHFAMLVLNTYTLTPTAIHFICATDAISFATNTKHLAVKLDYGTLRHFLDDPVLSWPRPEAVKICSLDSAKRWLRQACDSDGLRWVHELRIWISEGLRVWLKGLLNPKGWNSHVLREPSMNSDSEILASPILGLRTGRAAASSRSLEVS